ncbi:MAG: hypothetical protein COU83_02790 [Candidatus Portnoybacteria bacterium CG10_big_fil_rev_8_21_14_0_10_40_22]|uniref:DUF6602 domain-containing protein n=2 Tax=Candidatus Portnoyibacteriota TaxID=1817913 RepID=A0A2M8KFF0_9BACT|nr:MAG: hypothetical protein AUJ33_01350 [Parcubacteria group bacterium CG1_02_40_25]PIZ71016.1 MAG: hypothetical protein COY09_01625 [Candidatus Portnoybacteria bacterium CG_4_10_14_0_2_um_filter_39_11]PJE58642.1 MAG: hypothetical protein COU83_02790 [Candidatus Portnoybacteria bacterium CG10_big_fil_rev_8_21_14_0_10_40_22]
MANINAPKIEYFESIAAEIISKFRRLQSIVRHPTAYGDHHEEILKTVLRNFLTKRFSVKKGFIYVGHGKVSRQIDLMIIDENSPAAYIFQEGDFAVVLPQAVVAVMEIKTTLNVPDFEKALENVSSAKSLMEFPANLTGIVFAYDGTNPTNDVLDVWFKRQKASVFKGKEDVAPDAIMFFAMGRLLVRGDENKNIGGGKYYYSLIGGKNEIKSGMDSKAYQMSVILAMIINSCEQKEFIKTGRLVERQGFKLVQIERGALEDVRFAFKTGMERIGR